MERLEKGEIPDLYEHFSQPWISALCSDRWEPFLQDLKHLYKVHVSGFLKANLQNEQTLFIV